jgi:Integrase core domain
VRTLRRECLDHILPLSEQHVRSVLAEFVAYCNRDRPHRSLGLETPVARRRPVYGEVVSACPRWSAPRLRIGLPDPTRLIGG